MSFLVKLGNEESPYVELETAEEAKEYISQEFYPGEGRIYVKVLQNGNDNGTLKFSEFRSVNKAHKFLGQLIINAKDDVLRTVSEK